MQHTRAPLTRRSPEFPSPSRSTRRRKKYKSPRPSNSNDRSVRIGRIPQQHCNASLARAQSSWRKRVGICSSLKIRAPRAHLLTDLIRTSGSRATQQARETQRKPRRPDYNPKRAGRPRVPATFSELGRGFAFPSFRPTKYSISCTYHACRE